jgi:hypothetical protein
MSQKNFRSYYQILADDQILQVLADKKDLVPEAVAVLDEEVKKRQLKPPGLPYWTRGTDSTEPVTSLEDYSDYQELATRKRAAGRYVYLLALAPMVLGLSLAKKAFENSIAFISICCAWMAIVIACTIVINIRFLDFKCPQCSDKFGSEDKCVNCGFPRSAPTDQR